MGGNGWVPQPSNHITTVKVCQNEPLLTDGVAGHTRQQARNKWLLAADHTVCLMLRVVPFANANVMDESFS
jgi:hypothetical protein